MESNTPCVVRRAILSTGLAAIAAFIFCACMSAGHAPDAGSVVNECVSIVVIFPGDGEQLAFELLNTRLGDCSSNPGSYACDAHATSLEQCEQEIAPSVQQELDEVSPQLNGEVSCVNVCNE